MRPHAKVNDWVFGLGGSRLKAKGRCIFAMQVTRIVTFDEYWSNHEFEAKKPRRNGSDVMMAGDNIYHRDSPDEEWVQENSHHSHSDGTKNSFNTKKDTSADAVLLSDHFYYFGREAQLVPPEILNKIGYKLNVRNRTYRRILGERGEPLISWVRSFQPNRVHADPFDFESVHKRFSGHKIV